ncbi:GerMN domain-containing protein [Merdimonas faecis]|uniref:GerMN domain-containing protein n=1 Tax=Merdimonas faecis TaxID=1653435 RepID=UPI0022E98AC4|nr:GerMN domain-containing protein [Merdimonas faecis]
MRKRHSIMVIFVVCMLVLAGCGKSEPEETKEEKNQTEALEIENQEDNEEQIGKEDDTEDSKAQGSESEQQETAVSSKTVTIYSPNEMADGFVTEDVQTTDVTESWVVEQLIAQGVIPGNVQALSCAETQEDGVKSLNLDLNQAFADFLQSLGSTGEYMVVGSVCNTFLDAYDCNQVQITVEGNALATGHAEYPGYMSQFDL